MSGRQVSLWLLATLVGGLAISVAAADEPTPQQTEQLARMQAVLEAQQAKISGLEQQLASAARADMDAARLDEMKQQIREVLSEQQFRESLMPSVVQAGYDKGFFIKSSDDKFKMKFNGQFQFRYTYYQAQKRNQYLSPGLERHDRSGFDFARARLRISGNAYTKDLTYLMEFDMSSPGAYDSTLLYGWFNYRFMDEFQMKAGIFRLASTRADFGSTSTMQFPEYPMTNAIFGMNRGTGLRLWGKLLKGRGEYYLDIVNSLWSATTQTITTDEQQLASGHDNNPAILFRTVWAILEGTTQYPEGDKDLTAPSDMEIHTTPALNAGFHYAYTSDYNDGTVRVPFPRRDWPGGFGLTTSQGLQFHQFGLDAGFKYEGFSLTGEYIVRIQDVTAADHAPFAPLFLATGDSSTNAAQGAYVQAGYFLPIPGWERKFELVTRIGGTSAIANGQEGQWDYAGGFNYYIDGHRIKLQTDVTKVTEAPISYPTYSLANVNDSALIWRVQLQVAF
jgi:hypothetical protein